MKKDGCHFHRPGNRMVKLLVYFLRTCDDFWGESF